MTSPLNLFAWNSPQVCNMEPWLVGCVCVQGLRGSNSGFSVCWRGLAGHTEGAPLEVPTPHSWIILMTAEWPEAVLIQPTVYLRPSSQTQTVHFTLLFTDTIIQTLTPGCVWYCVYLPWSSVELTAWHLFLKWTQDDLHNSAAILGHQKRQNY